jgi:hypothetical protein
MEQGIARNRADEMLKRQDVFRSDKGKNHEKLFSLVEQPVPVQEEVRADVPPAPAQAELVEAEVVPAEVPELEAA